MAKSKQTIMDMTPQELLKMFVSEVGLLIDARNEMQKTLFTAEIKASEMRTTDKLMTEIKASEKRTKDELRSDIKASEQRLTQKIETIEVKLDATVASHTNRLE